jgi:hypothetical protein
MTTTTQRKKTSTSFKVGIIVIFVVLISVAILAIIGLIDLSWLGNGYLAVQAWSATDIVNALLIDVALVFLGVGLMYGYFTYIRGNKVIGSTVSQPGYTPTPSYPTPQQQDKETVIS